MNYRFHVQIDGIIVGGFSEVSGLQVEVETEDYIEGGVNDYVFKLPKGTKHANLVLKRGIADWDILWKWHKNVVSGRIVRRNVHVFLLDTGGLPRQCWTFENAYPVKWIGPDFKAESAGIAVESVEFCHQGVKQLWELP